LPRLLGATGGMAPYDHDPEEPPRPHRVPPPTPRLALGARCVWVREPARGSVGQGLGGAEQGAFFAWSAARFVGWRGRQRIERGAAGKTPDHMGGRGTRPDVGLGGRAAVSEATERPPGPLLGDNVAASPGHLTAGTIRDVALLGWRGRERACAAPRATAAVAGPPLAGHPPPAHHAVHAPQRPVCWPC
jgi:hypothetical protein